MVSRYDLVVFIFPGKQGTRPEDWFKLQESLASTTVGMYSDAML